MDPSFEFAEETTPSPDSAFKAAASDDSRCWNILIVDDDEAVHVATRFALKGFEFDGRKLRILSAHSGEEARAVLAGENDIALALLDVVMEEDKAGLHLVRHIREQLNNREIRIILRTGQPGMAPEESIIQTYDINDYKNKTELTSTSFRTLLISALRAYRDICALRNHRQGLERVIGALREIERAHTAPDFARAVLEQLKSLVSLSDRALQSTVVAAFAEIVNAPGYRLLAVFGRNHEPGMLPAESAKLPPAAEAKLRLAAESRCTVADADDYLAFFSTESGSENVLYLAHRGSLTALDKALLDLYCVNVAAAFESMLLHEKVEQSQRELIWVLGTQAS